LLKTSRWRSIAVAVVSFAFAATTIGPALAADDPALVAQATATAISGVVKTPGGATVPGASVSVRGPVQMTALTGDDGSFSIAVPPGIYAVTINKGGFQPASLEDVTVAQGQTQPLAISLAPVDLSTLRTIGTVTATGRGASAINTGAATQAFVSRQQFTNSGEPGVNAVLQRVPDVVIQKLGTQADTSIVVGGLQPYETQVLIDGHPVALGQYGVWFSQYFPSYLIGGVETESGPGNTTPFANIAVGGTVNLTTPGFTTKQTAEFSAGYDNYQSQNANLLATGSAGNLKYVVAAGTAGTNGWWFKKTACDVYQFAGAPNTPGFVGIVPFCGDFSGSFHNRGVLGKIQYNFSQATSFEFSFLGTFGGYSPQGSAWGESFGQVPIVACLPNSLECTSPQNANLIGTTINGYYWFPGTDIQNTQQMWDAQLRTSIGSDTIVVRPYLAAIQPETYVGKGEGYFPSFYGPNFSASSPYPACPPVGTAPTVTCNPGPPSLPPGTQIPGSYNNTFLPAPNQFESTACQPGTINSFSQINSPGNTIVSQGNQEECFQYPYSTYEQDKLYGSTFSYLHPFGDSFLNFTYDFHGSSTFAYINSPANYAVPYSSTRYSTFSLTGSLAMVPHLKINFGLYNTQWTASGQQPTFDPSGNFTGYGPLFRSVSRFDPHFALVFNPKGDTSYRAAAGSSETFPFIGDISGAAIVQPPAFGFTAGSVTQKNPGLLPEYAMAYDVGADHRFHNGAVATLDLQDTIVQNVFQQSTLLQAVACPSGTCILGIFAPINVARLEAQLVTFKYTYAPATGLGYNFNAAADSSIFSGIPAQVYNANPGLPANNVQVCGGAAFTPGLATCIPYLKMYGQVTYAWKNGGFASIGADFEGKNNAYYLPPFTVVDFAYRQPLTKWLELAISVQNVFNTDTFDYLPAQNLGVPAVGNFTPDGVTVAQGSFSTYRIPAATRTVLLQLRAHLGR
jgi:outer membrane receptor protein involved in Fe transport